MNQSERMEFKELITEVIQPLVVELKAGHAADEKEIERLTRQSAEHYANFRNLDAKFRDQVSTCQSTSGLSHEKIGARVGELENAHGVMSTRVDGLEELNKESESKKQFGISSWLVVGSILVVVILEVISLVGG